MTVRATLPDLNSLTHDSLWELILAQHEKLAAQEEALHSKEELLACSRCNRIVQAKAVSRPIAGGMAGPDLLANALASKYCDHLPLYRQSEIYARAEVGLDRATLADWVGSASALLEPLVEALRRHVMNAEKLHADDTPVPVLAPGLGKTKTGRLWTCVRDDRPAADPTPPAVRFAYSPDRKGEHPAKHLAEFRGFLQAGAYAGFNQFYEGGRIQEVAYWAHVRRKFYDLQVAHKSPVAREALERIASLYAIECEIRASRRARGASCGKRERDRYWSHSRLGWKAACPDCRGNRTRRPQ